MPPRSGMLRQNVSEDLGPLGSLSELYPGGVLEIGADRGMLQHGAPGTLSAPALPATEADRQRLTPSPEDQTAGLLSSASRGGKRDSLGRMLLEAGVAGAGPLSGIFAALGASLAKRDPDAAAAMAQEGFRQLKADELARQQIEEQRRHRILQNRIDTFRLAVAANTSKKTLKEMLNGILVDQGIQISEGEQDLVVNQPAVRNLVGLGRPPTSDDVSEYLKLRESGDLPDDIQTVQLADAAVERFLRRNQTMNDPAIVRAVSKPPGESLTTEEAMAALSAIEASGVDLKESPTLQIAAKRAGLTLLPASAEDPTEVMSRDDARTTIGAQLAATGLNPKDAELFIPEGVTEMSTRQVEQIRDSLPEAKSPLGTALGGLLADRANAPQFAAFLSRLTPNEAFAASREIRELGNLEPSQLVARAADTIAAGEPLTPGMQASLQYIYATVVAPRSANVGKALGDQAFLIDDPQDPQLEVLRGAEAALFNAAAQIPDLLDASEELGSTFTEQDLEALVGGMFDQVDELQNVQP